ncbi:MAG: hypothetical protein NT117_10370 [Gammaproteobacteria bacterium]|nr:hypothetical protein [Gammaproteobacteria bacterium]
MPKTPWKPPMWLLALDFIGLGLLGLGLAMHFAPDSAVAQALPATLRLPLLALGGGLFAFCWSCLVMSLLDHRRH